MATRQPDAPFAAATFDSVSKYNAVTDCSQCSSLWRVTPHICINNNMPLLSPHPAVCLLFSLTSHYQQHTMPATCCRNCGQKVFHIFSLLSPSSPDPPLGAQAAINVWYRTLFPFSCSAFALFTATASVVSKKNVAEVNNGCGCHSHSWNRKTQTGCECVVSQRMESGSEGS